MFRRGDKSAAPKPDPQLAFGPFFHSRYLCRELARVFKQLVQSDLIPAGGDLLDYGCGSKPYKVVFQAKFEKHVGVDLGGVPQADYELDAAGRIPLEAGKFSMVLSSQVLEHVEDPAMYLAEARRVLRDDGLLLLSTHGLYRYHPSPNDYWRWTFQGLRRQVELAGFEVITMRGILGMPSAALHLWQLATMNYLPTGLRQIYIWVIQGIVTLIERFRRGSLPSDAIVYVVLARKTKVARLCAR
jgi:SAM-dependent methyltransferase